MKPVVLYAENDANDVFLLERAFRRVAPNLDLRIVNDGLQAIDYLSGEKAFSERPKHPLPHLVILDLRMPSLSGIEVLHWIRKHPVLFNLPVVLFSGLRDTCAIPLAECLGISDYIIKPFGHEEYLEAVKQMLRSLPLPDCPSPSSLPMSTRTAAAGPRPAAR